MLFEGSSMPSYAPGDYVKVEFRDEATGIGEWMWVRVERCDDKERLVFGTLHNAADYGRKVKLGSELAASYDQIREHKTAAEFQAPKLEAVSEKLFSGLIRHVGWAISRDAGVFVDQGFIAAETSSRDFHCLRSMVDRASFSQ
jgi:hypothetical protein